MKIDMKADITGANLTLKRVQKRISKNTYDMMFELKEKGKEHAKQIAPKWSQGTQDTAKLIRGIVSRKADGWEAIILAPNPTKGGSNRFFPQKSDYPDFNLVRWMHETGGVFQSDNMFGKKGTKHIKSGDPRFMYTTRDYLNKIKKDVAQRHFKTRITQVN